MPETPEVYEGTTASTGSEGPCGFRHVEHAMGTVFSFDIRDTPTPAIHRAFDQAVVWLHWVDEVGLGKSSLQLKRRICTR